ncbi:hypothetical protein OH786_18425 [Streptomyces atratus]|uniref:Uncharacterized protein n=1 Tax=Streptomyces atratus TaxID=1893 RepID=A0A1K2EHV6_STRAR|nr:hypothetical protein [Streptomyces atratus]SFY34596.1 hypothetical protein SAMN02787144_101986 [Streptomyces atratus]
MRRPAPNTPEADAAGTEPGFYVTRQATICGPHRLRPCHNVPVAAVKSGQNGEACDSWRASAPETQRREAMTPYIVEEQECFYHGRELGVGPA